MTPIIIERENLIPWLIERRRESFKRFVNEDDELVDEIRSYGHVGYADMSDNAIIAELREYDLLEDARKEGFVVMTVGNVEKDLRDAFLEMKVEEAMDDPEWHLRKLWSLRISSWDFSTILEEMDEGTQNEVIKRLREDWQ